MSLNIQNTWRRNFCSEATVAIPLAKFPSIKKCGSPQSKNHQSLLRTHTTMATQAISWPLLLIMSLYVCSLIPDSTSEPTFVYHTCQNSTSFAANSQYHTNLKTIFQSLSSNATAPAPSLFYATATGNGTADAVYGLFLCRGDQNATTCNDCVTMATKIDLPTVYCSDKKAAVIYYDQCMVRYSNHPILGTIDQSAEDRILMNDFNTKGNSTLLNQLLVKMMNDMTVQAAAGDNSGKKFAVKQTNFTKTEDLYTLVQCTPDLSSNDCSQCLKELIPKLLVKKQGAQVLRPNCIARYENYPFYIGAVALPVIKNSTDSSANRRGKKKVSGKTIAAIVVPVAFASLGLLVIGACLITKKAKKYDPVAFAHGEDFTNVESLQYDLATLQSATNNFSDENKLGEGGFGGVYKGKLPEGQLIAVKRLSRSSGQGIQEFKNEVLVVAKLQHRNLARLLGFCVAGEEKLLVYEYVPNKSLDYFLFDPERQGQLNWSRRYKIIAGIARGMVYLHQDSRLRIIHRDLKACNILLDADMNPKVSDFGMARIFGVDQTQGNTSRVVGTYGYMSPEYAMHGQFSVKSDVYSFGVLILEIISGKKNSNFYESGYAEDLLSYAWKKWEDGAPLEFVDPTIRNTCSKSEVMRCLHLGLLCVQESIDDRPTMATAVLMLESQTVTLPVPQQPAFFIKSTTGSNFIGDIGFDQSTSKSVPWSVNDASVTDIEPR